MTTATSEDRTLRRVIMLAAAMLGIAALFWGRELFIPLALAAFLSLLLAPLVRGLERLRLGRVLSVLLVVTAAIALIGLIIWLVVIPATQLVTDFRQYRHEISAKLGTLRTSVGGTVGKVSSMVDAVVGESKRITEEAEAEAAASIMGPPMASPPPTMAESVEKPLKVEVVEETDLLGMAFTYINPLVSPLVTGGLAIVFCIFFLINREDLRDRILRLAGRAQIGVTTAALADSARRVTRYVAAQALANTMIGATLAVGLFILGIPNAPLWGLLSAVLRFVPYVGAFIAAAFPIAQSLAIFDGWWQAFAVLALVLGVDTFSGNFIEPWLYGSQVGASPTALIFSFVLWSLLWGGIGLILATPITVCLVVLGKHTPGFEVFYILLGNEPALEPAIRFYQRLLAQDRREALLVAQEFKEKASWADLADQVILPALAQLESDRRDGLLEAPRAEFARQTVTELLELLKPPADPEVTASEVAATPAVAAPVLVILDRGAFDELLPVMVTQGAEVSPTQLRVVTRDSLATEIVAQVRQQQPAAVVLAAIEPRDASRLQHVLKRLQSEQIEIPIHLAVFSTQPRSLRAARPVGSRGVLISHSTLASLVQALLESPWRPLPAGEKMTEPVPLPPTSVMTTA